MYYNEIGRLKIKKNLKFARFPPKIIPFADYPFDTNNYPRLQIMFPYYQLNCINSFDCPHDNWMDHYKWDSTILQKHDCIRYIYQTLMQQLIYFGHNREYFAKYKFNQVPKTIQDQKDKIRLQKEEEQKRKAPKIWLFGLPNCKKKEPPKQLAAQQNPSK
jgi:hypothetical protein